MQGSKRLSARLILPIATASMFVLMFGACQKFSKTAPTLAEAKKFIADAENWLADLSVKESRAAWVQANFITDDTEVLASQANQNIIEATTKIASDVKRFDGMKLPPVLDRKFKLLKLSLFSLSDPKEREEVATLGANLEAEYGKGKACPQTGKYRGKSLPIGEVEQIFAKSRDPEELKEIWQSWNAVGAPLKQKYTRFIQLQNKGAQELGFKDMGAMWRSNYDMTPEQFTSELERLWNQVRPLYESLHAYVRSRLVKQYGNRAITPEGLIKADLPGNPWAQEWGNIFPIIGNSTGAKHRYDLTTILAQKKVDQPGMVHYGENFFKSLGFAPLDF
jgi:peptidyl-dipeptidase A